MPKKLSRRRKGRKSDRVQSEFPISSRRCRGWGKSANITHKDIDLIRRSIREKWPTTVDAMERIANDLYAEIERTDSDRKFYRAAMTLMDLVNKHRNDLAEAMDAEEAS